MCLTRSRVCTCVEFRLDNFLLLLHFSRPKVVKMRKKSIPEEDYDSQRPLRVTRTREMVKG